MPKEDFTQEQLNAAWKAYAQIQSDAGNRSMAMTLNYRDPVLEDGFRVHFTIDNAVQANYFETGKMAILDHLRNQLQNWQIKLDIILNAQNADGPTVKTDAERMQAFISENDALRDLINRLKLDWD